MEGLSLPIVCTLTPEAFRERKTHVLQRLGTAVQEIVERDAGYAYRFPAEGTWLIDLAHMVQLERMCCAFLTFQIVIEPANGPIWLEISGPPGMKSILPTFFA